MSVGLPSWEEFLRNCLARAKGASEAPEDSWWFVEKLLAQGDLLTVAELIQQVLGSQLDEYFWEVFGKGPGPSVIHHSIARLPFSIAVTTNFDLLLEAAYPSPAYPRTVVAHTWRDPAAFVSAIKQSRFAIVKTHGVAGNSPSLIITRNQYRNLIHGNDAFNSCLRTLLSLRTFLFVGASLRDQDLLKLMDEARLMYGPEFGPHYAILFDDEVDAAFVKFLDRSYGIKVLICRRPAGEPATWWSEDNRRATASAARLREISGRVAVLRHAMIPSPVLDDALFYRRKASEQLLRSAIELTGSFRGEICFIRSSKLKSLRRESEHRIPPPDPGMTAVVSQKPFGHIPPHSVIGSVFLKAGQKDAFVYLPDAQSESLADALRDQGLPATRYKVCHPDVRSELACTINSDGKLVGVINVESKLPHAYTREHLDVLRRCADQAGWIYSEANQRMKSGQGFQAYLRKPERFRALLDLNRELRQLNLHLILWEIDYLKGRLIAHPYPQPLDYSAKKPFVYRFEENSLATKVFRERRREFVADADSEIMKGNDSLLAEKGCIKFDVHGPVVALPVQIQGHTSAVLVAWSGVIPNKDKGQEICNRRIFERELKERIHRTAHLIANDVGYLPTVNGTRSSTYNSRARDFIDYIDAHCRGIDKGGNWTEALLWSKAFRHQIADVLINSLLQPCCGLLRVRLWAATQHKEGRPFECIRSVSLPEATVPGKRSQNQYVGVFGSADDPYVEYTCARYKNDPYAQHQNKSMFGAEDKNCKDLDKDPNGSWIVGAVTRNAMTKDGFTSLCGFLSADTHCPIKNVTAISGYEMKERSVPGALQTFQRYAIDVVTELLGYVWTYERWRPRTR